MSIPHSTRNALYSSAKGDPFVVFFLAFDVIHNLILVMYAIGYGSIFMPPPPKIRKRRIRLEPFAGECLYGLYILCHRYCCRERDKDMYMVWHTTDTINLSVQVVGLLHNDGVEFSVVFDRDRGFTTIGTENDMVKRLNITHSMITGISVTYCGGIERVSPRRIRQTMPIPAPHYVRGYEEHVPPAR